MICTIQYVYTNRALATFLKIVSISDLCEENLYYSTYSTNVDKKNLLNWYSLSLSILSHQKGSTDAVPGMTTIKLILYAAYGSSTVLSRLERIHLLDILYNV